VNFIYLTGNKTVSATAYEIPERMTGDREVKIPEGAENFKASYDGSFVSYFIDGRLELMDVAGKNGRKTLGADDKEITFYRWLPDRNMVIYAMKSSGKQDGIVSIYTYDMDTEIERSYPDIKGLPKRSRVVGIELSPLTNVVYVKTKIDETNARIHKFNIMDNLLQIRKIKLNSVIKETNYKDRLLYQEAGGSIIIRNGSDGAEKRLGPKSNVVLLDVDLKDNIFIGELDKGGNVARIAYGKAEEPYGSWNTIRMSEPVPPADLIVTPGGRLYRHVKSENSIYSLDGGEKIMYKGELIEVHDDFILTRDKNRLKLAAIKKGG